MGEVFPKEAEAVESKCCYELHSMVRILMGSMEYPKTKREREEEKRCNNLRREVQKGKRPVVVLPKKKNKKKPAPSRDRHKVVLVESEVVPSSEIDEVEIFSPQLSIHVSDFEVEGKVNQSIR